MENLSLEPFVDELTQKGWTPTGFYKENEYKNQHKFTLSFLDHHSDNILLFTVFALLRDQESLLPSEHNEAPAQEEFKLDTNKTKLTVIQGKNRVWQTPRERVDGRKEINFDWKYLARYGMPTREQVQILLLKGYKKPPITAIKKRAKGILKES